MGSGVMGAQRDSWKARFLGSWVFVSLLFTSGGLPVRGAALDPIQVAQAFETALIQLVQRAEPAVVGISATDVRSPAALQRLLEEEPVPFTSGTGFFIRPEGYILTTDHVVHDAREIRVRLLDGQELEAQLVGADPNTDLAVLKVDPPNPPVFLEFADSDAVSVGQFVVAIGNPLGLEFSASIGIVSAKGRGNLLPQNEPGGLIRYQDFIQTDAYLNQGNSGGPLLNLQGQVVGVNSMIRVGRGGDFTGIGFAIPANIARVVAEQLIRNGRVVRGWLGIRFVAQEDGVHVRQVLPNSPAERAGLRSGDLLVEMNGQRLSGRPEEISKQFSWAIANTPVGATLQLTVEREGRRYRLPVSVGEMPPEYTGQRVETPLTRLGFDGISMTPEIALVHQYPETVRGMLVVSTPRDGAAYRAGLRPGHVITQVNGKPISGKEECEAQILEAIREPSPRLTLTVRTPGGVQELPFPEEALRQLREWVQQKGRGADE